MVFACLCVLHQRKEVDKPSSVATACSAIGTCAPSGHTFFAVVWVPRQRQGKKGEQKEVNRKMSGMLLRSWGELI